MALGGLDQLGGMNNFLMFHKQVTEETCEQNSVCKRLLFEGCCPRAYTQGFRSHKSPFLMFLIMFLLPLMQVSGTILQAQLINDLKNYDVLLFLQKEHENICSTQVLNVCQHIQHFITLSFILAKLFSLLLTYQVNYVFVKPQFISTNKRVCKISKGDPGDTSQISMKGQWRSDKTFLSASHGSIDYSKVTCS